MTDKELLELAAKAAGIEIVWYPKLGNYYIPSHSEMLDDLRWNPLTDDGEALWLAVKLQLSIHVCAGYSSACSGEPYFVDEEVIDNDPHKATRRAIVLAAAEIGKGMS